MRLRARARVGTAYLLLVSLATGARELERDRAHHNRIAFHSLPHPPTSVGIPSRWRRTSTALLFRRIPTRSFPMRRYFFFLLLNAAVASAAPAPKSNPQIAGVVREISPQKIEASIRKLVSFGTRHTLSDATSETRGIGAARRWLQTEFERYAKECDGRLQVTMDEFIQPPGERNPQAVPVVNVVATLPGEQAESR